MITCSEKDTQALPGWASPRPRPLRHGFTVRAFFPFTPTQVRSPLHVCVPWFSRGSAHSTILWTLSLRLPQRTRDALFILHFRNPGSDQRQEKQSHLSVHSPHVLRAHSESRTDRTQRTHYRTESGSAMSCGIRASFLEKWTPGEFASLVT